MKGSMTLQVEALFASLEQHLAEIILVQGPHLEPSPFPARWISLTGYYYGWHYSA
jgi:hypothetical protein